MATIDIKLKSYDELIFEITKLNTDKYLLEQENKQLKEKIDKALRKLKSSVNHFRTQRENNAVTFTIRILEGKENEQ